MRIKKIWIKINTFDKIAHLNKTPVIRGYVLLQLVNSLVLVTVVMILTHWGRVTHLCVGKLNSIASDNGLSPGRRQAITWTNLGILFIGPLGTNFSEILIEIHTFSFKKIHLKMSSAKWRPCCLGLNVLKAISEHVLQIKFMSTSYEKALGKILTVC